MSFFGGDSFYNTGGRNKNYKWKEVKTINKGANSFTLDHDVNAGEMLQINDTKYGEIWSTPLHWNRNEKVVTLTESALFETLSFEVYCYE